MAARLSPILAGGAALAACLGAAPAAAVDIGSAVRTNYALRTWDEAERDRGGELDAELLRLDLDGEIGGLLLSAEYRVCPGFGFDTVHHAWVGYDVAHWRARLGIVQVPFGLLPFASHSWWLGIGYYLGLEDDYDAGGGVGEPRHRAARRPAGVLQAAGARLRRLGALFVRHRARDAGGDPAQQHEEINQINARRRSPV